MMGEEVIEIGPPVKDASVLLKRNFKGEHGWEIKIPYDPENEAIADVLKQIKFANDALRNMFIEG